MIGDGTAIVGVGATRLGKQPGRSSVDLQAEAVTSALDNAGLTHADVDAVYALGPYSSPSMMWATTLSEYIGLRPALQAAVDAGGGVTAMMMLANAAWAIQSGQADVAVCVYGEAAATGRVKEGSGWTSTSEPNEFEAAWGISGPLVSYALLASRYMAEFGLTPDDLGAIAVAHREHASRHPNATRRDPITLEDHRSSRMIASPLRLLDCSTIVDGAGAFVVTSTAQAAKLQHPPVAMLSLRTQTTNRNVLDFPGFGESNVRTLADRALADAGVTLDDVDVALLYDAFTFNLAWYLEELGFCGRGESGRFTAEGGLGLDAPCPVNTHGGLLSQGHVGGMLHVVEAVEQLRGAAGDRQVDGCATALVVGGGGILGVNGAMLLGLA